MGDTIRPKRILPLDSWRGIAILLVLWGHFSYVAWMNLGAFGVEFFFVLSGRLMAQILYVNAHPLPEFFFRRATRILPALFGFVTIYLLVSSFIGEPFSLSPVWAVTALTFTINYVTIFTHGTGWFDHIWSLCVEEHAYFLLGGLVLLFGRGIRRAAILLGGLAALMMLNGIVSYAVLNQSFETVYHRSDVHVASVFIAASVFLFVRHLANAVLVRRLALPVFLVALGLGIGLNLTGMPTVVSYSLGTFCLAVAVSLVDIASRQVTAVLSSRVLTQFGLWSYSIYLWQQPFYKLDRMYDGLTIWLLLAALGCGIASYYVIERPARRGLNALWPRLEQRLSKFRSARTPPAAADKRST